MNLEKLTLDNIGKPGLVEELFEHELAKVLQNVADVNTETKTKRTITLTFEVLPDLERQNLKVNISATSKLAPIPKQEGHIFVEEKRYGKPEAYVPIQLEEKELFENVEPMNKEAGNA